MNSKISIEKEAYLFYKNKLNSEKNLKESVVEILRKKIKILKSSGKDSLVLENKYKKERESLVALSYKIGYLEGILNEWRYYTIKPNIFWF